MNLSSTRAPRPAVTLVEIITTMALLALLMAVLVPSIKSARDHSRNVVCLSNLRQMGVAANIYVDANDGQYPVASWKNSSKLPEIFVILNWDYTTTVDWSAGGVTTFAGGLLWSDRAASQIQQCPLFRGSSSTVVAEPHTGYNYNTSYIGHGIDESIPAPARQFMVTNPAWTAMFGDGEWGSGANKFMRAPWPNPGDQGFFGRYAGTQGYRHRGMTNLAFADAHAQSWEPKFVDTSPAEQQYIAPATGFVSSDNSLYDLE